jgi:hypothetical protein
MAGRYDIYIQVVPKAAYTGTRFYSFGRTRSFGIRGMQKLVNMFSKYLLTPAGTDPLDPSYGTDIPHLFSSNVDLRDVKDILVLAVDKTAAAIRGYQNAQDIPDEERLAGATVTAMLLIDNGPGFAAQILLQNVLNQGLQLLLPTLETRV